MFRAFVLSTSNLLCAVLFLTTALSASATYALPSASVIAIDRPTADAVALRDWSPLSTVTVEVLSGPGGSALMSPMSVPVDASGGAIIPVPVAFAAGQVVRASLALVTKEITLTTLTVQADATADVISGAAPAAAVVNIEVCNLAVCSSAPVTTADAAGRYIVSVGSLAFPASNIRVGTTFSAVITDVDGDSQRVEGVVSPTVSTILGMFPGGPGGTIVLNGWAPATSLTIERLTSGGTVLETFVGPADANGFLEFGAPALAAGQRVRASGGTTVKELTIVPFSVQGNTATDELSGNAPSSALVTVQAHCGSLVPTACMVTRLLAANGAGLFATSLAPTIDIRGGSDLSASIADVDGDRQYAKVGPMAVDTDRDGIADLIDVQPAIPSAAFNETPTGPTLGQVLSDGGLMVTVVDAVPPTGVTVAAVGGGPGAVAQVEGFCTPSLILDLTAGDRMELTCSSPTVRVLSGPVTIHVPGFPAVVSVPTGSTAKLSVLATGELQVQNIAGGASISVTVGNMTTLVRAGGSYLVSALPTCTDQCKHGGWKSFGSFKNQGDCVRFVTTKGKNGPTR